MIGNDDADGVWILRKLKQVVDCPFQGIVTDTASLELSGSY